MGEAPTRERIVMATLEELEASGMAGLTIRSIAERAGVNVAAVNYHFGSKAKLMEAVLAQTLRHGLWESLEELREAMSGASDPAAAARRYLREFIGNMIRYPRLTEAHLHEALVRQDYDAVAVREMGRFVEALFPVLRPALPSGTEPEQRASLAQFWYALLGTTVLPGLFEPFLGPAGVEVSSPGYVERLLDVLLPGSGG